MVHRANRVRLLGTSSVYLVPTKPVDGTSLDLVVKHNRVGEDVPLNTHTLQEFMSTEFNSPWEEFSLVMEMGDKHVGQRLQWIRVQRPLAIYVPPQRMQIWQSGRSRAKINRIRARHPGVDLDILKQYKLIYEWIRGKNLVEIFEHIRARPPRHRASSAGHAEDGARGPEEKRVPHGGHEARARDPRRRGLPADREGGRRAGAPKRRRSRWTWSTSSCTRESTR